MKSKKILHLTLFTSLFGTLLLTGCNSAYKKLVTYHVEFVADGIHYNLTTQYPWYYAQTFEYTRHYADYNKAVIRGYLKDGSEYIVNGSGYYYYESGHTDTKSTIFVRVTPTIVESFDSRHFHSPHHQIHITKSYVDIRDLGEVPYEIAKNIGEHYNDSLKSLSHYHSVGAKITPFLNAKQAEDDFFNTSPPPFQAPRAWKKPIFNFHPGDAVMENSDVDVTYNAAIFHASLPSTGLAATWILDRKVAIEGPGVTFGDRPDIVVEFNGEELTIPPTITLKAQVDPVSRKAIIFYEGDAGLRF